ncbi:ROK family protein [Reichenbachiella agarivorans]|uniref:ROK family protein n=1 Tax=Reichenbachiella agarivorans TaxID=2979464 RepID=A0ABY6CPF5_9BACT|nr:ROK family protein [Reichenbachiella agarivorans]UXP32401.1 ROK family protein [Reichenbachiella agarivorans]
MKRLIVGIDIGGTGTKLGLVDSLGEVIIEEKISTTGEHTFAEFITTLSKIVKQWLLAYPDYEIAGVGVGAPGGNFYTGCITDASNLPWKGSLPLVELLTAELNVPVVLSNDANAATMGEMIFGAAKGMKDFVMITLGTGLGSGIVTGGRLLIGAESLAAELGHVLIKGKGGGRACKCGRKGCLETYVSATGIKRTYLHLLASQGEQSRLSAVPFDQLEAKDIAQAALDGDEIAKKAFVTTGKILGRQLANMVSIVNPEAVFLFGGLASAGDLIFEPTKKYMDANMLNIYKAEVKILPSQLEGANAAIVGAASLVYQYEQDSKEVLA